MHKKLLSDNERKVINRYLETGEKLEGFNVLLHRARKETLDESEILADLRLIKEIVSKTGTK